MSKIRLLNGTKNNNTSSHMLLDHCYAFRLLLLPSSLKKKFFEEGTPTPFDLFLPHPGSAPGRIWPNSLMHVQGHEHFIPMCSNTYTCITAYPPPPLSVPK